MGQVTTVKYICDCCGIESDKSDFNNGFECGSSNFKLNGNIGGMAYNGDWGGGSHSLNDFICFGCARKLIEHYEQMKVTQK